MTVALFQANESSAMCSVNNDAVPAEVDETHSHMKPVVAPVRLDLARSLCHIC